MWFPRMDLHETVLSQVRSGTDARVSWERTEEAEKSYSGKNQPEKELEEASENSLQKQKKNKDRRKEKF